jgi:hypothetical protein
VSHPCADGRLAAATRGSTLRIHRDRVRIPRSPTQGVVRATDSAITHVHGLPLAAPPTPAWGKLKTNNYKIPMTNNVANDRSNQPTRMHAIQVYLAPLPLMGWQGLLPFANSKIYNSRYDLEPAGIDLAPLGSSYPRARNSLIRPVQWRLGRIPLGN